MYEPRVHEPALRCLRYAYAESSHGRVMVAMSEDGVVDVILGDTREELLSKALRRFPGMSFIPDRGRHAHWVAAVIKRLESPVAGIVVPVDLRRGNSCRVRFAS